MSQTILAVINKSMQGSLFAVIIPQELNKKISNHYIRCITPKRVTSGGVHLHGLGPWQLSSEKTAVGDTASKLTGLVIKPETSDTDNDVANHREKVALMLNKLLDAFHCHTYVIARSTTSTCR